MDVFKVLWQVQVQIALNSKLSCLVLANLMNKTMFPKVNWFPARLLFCNHESWLKGWYFPFPSCVMDARSCSFSFSPHILNIITFLRLVSLECLVKITSLQPLVMVGKNFFLILAMSHGCMGTIYYLSLVPFKKPFFCCIWQFRANSVSIFK